MKKKSMVTLALAGVMVLTPVIGEAASAPETAAPSSTAFCSEAILPEAAKSNP